MASDEEQIAAGFSAIHRKKVRPKAKYAVIYRYRKEYSVSVMYCFFQGFRSGYCDFVHHLSRPEKDTTLAGMIAEQRACGFGTYGYRRMWLKRCLPQSQNRAANHEKVEFAVWDPPPQEMETDGPAAP